MKMENINISLTVKQTMAVLMVINDKISNNLNMRSVSVQRGGDKQRLELLDAEIKQLTEAYQAIQEAL